VSDEQAKVRQFMIEIKDLELPRQPIIPSEIVRNLCRALICEELAEVELAVAHKDIVEVAHELTDLLYVCYYMANAYGIYIEPIFDAIHQANMAKAGGPKLENGKQTKGPNYVKPNIKALIEVQLHD
jgi:predicted HAD superfamily Cof-like phosphohydrolase